MANAIDYRIEDVSRANVRSKPRIVFKAYRRTPNAPFEDSFVFVGEFSAPVGTAKRDLWKIADESGDANFEVSDQ